ncbi:enoyl-CoA hydratase/isomerase family protein [Micromonospora sp. NPDC005113]
MTAVSPAAERQVKLTRSGAIGTLRLNRPERLNALTETMLDQLDHTVRDINADDELKVVILAGAGRAFCAGRDTRELAGLGSEPGDLPERDGHATHRIADIDVPVIAATRGAVVGGGMGMVLMADLALAAESTYFLDGHLASGMCPSGSSWWLPRLVGYRQAMEVFLTGRRVNAAEALRMGIVNSVVPDAELDDSVNQLAGAIAKLDRAAILRTKRAVRHALENGFQASTEHISYLRALPRKRTE